jgi:hypothetical protein
MQGMNKVEKFDKFKRILAQFKFKADIIVIGETKLKTTFPHSIYNMIGYKRFTCCRNAANSGGGLMIFVKNQIKIINAETHTSSFQRITLDIQIEQKKFTLISYYRPPEPNNLYNFLDDLEDEIKQKEGRIVIVGDVNIDKNGNTKDARDYKNLLDSYSLEIVNDCPTRNASSKIIDHMACNFHKDFTIDNYTIHNSLSDHNMIITSFNDTINRHTLVLREMKRTDYENAKRDLEAALIKSNMFNETDPNKIALELTEILAKVIQKNTKKVRVKIRQENAECPWYNYKVLQILSRKRAISRKQRIYRNYQWKYKLKAISKKLKATIDYEKRKYYSEKLVTQNPRQMWRNINQLLGRKEKRNIEVLKLNDELIFNEKVMANKFNEYFIQSIKEVTPTYSPESCPCNFPSSSKSMCLEEVDEDEVHNAIMLLKNKAAPGIDKISTSDVKNLKDLLIPVLCHLINVIFCSATYPDIFKVAIVVPINKTGDTANIKDYRPVSVLPTINKIIEKIMHARIYNFIEKQNVLYSHQFGFRKKSCTETAAIEVVSHIRQILDKGGKIASAVFMDMTKAFDIVNRKTLLMVLENYGIRGKILKLLESYLTNRKQTVKINEAFSELLCIDSGVVQGSTLGSLLFVLFINGICKLKGLKGKLFLFADDIVLINMHDKKENAQEKMKVDMNIIINYIESLGMLMNMTKTNYMIFHTISSSYNDTQEIEVKANQVIQRVYSYKYLGLYLDPCLKWSDHAEHVKNKLCFASAVLWKLKRIIPRDVKKRIYFAIFQSHLLYMSQVYGNACDTVLKPLQTIQNRTLRNVFGLDRMENRINMYTHLVENCLPIRAIHYINTACYIYGNIHKNIHTNIPIEKSVTRGRSAARLRPVIGKTNYGKKDILSFGINIFNSIPNDIKTLKTLSSFKWALKCHIRNETFMSKCFDSSYFKEFGNFT